MKLGEYSGNILGEQDTAIAFHLDALTSPDRSAIVEENLHFISNRTMVTSAHMQATRWVPRLKTAKSPMHLFRIGISPHKSACGKVSWVRHMVPGGSRESLPKRKVQFADYPDFTFEINAEAIMTVTFRREVLKVKGDTHRDAVLGQDEAEIHKKQ